MLRVTFILVLLFTVLARLGLWLIGDPSWPAPPEATWIDRFVWPHLLLAVVGAILVWGVARVGRDAVLAGAGHHEIVWRSAVAPVWAAVVFSWLWKLLRRAGYDVQTLPRLKVEGGRLIFVLLIGLVIAYVGMSGKARARR